MYAFYAIFRKTNKPNIKLSLWVYRITNGKRSKYLKMNKNVNRMNKNVNWKKSEKENQWKREEKHILESMK